MKRQTLIDAIRRLRTAWLEAVRHAMSIEAKDRKREAAAYKAPSRHVPRQESKLVWSI